MEQTTTHQALLAVTAVAMLLTMPVAASEPSDAPPNPDATVLVRNNNYLDVQIFAVTEAGKRFELGTVTHGRERTFPLPNQLLENNEQFRLKICTLSRGMPTSIIDNHVAAVKTQPLALNPDAQISLTVASRLKNSYVDRGLTSQN